MKDHTSYSVADFLLDDSFVGWVKTGCSTDHYWARWLLNNPGKEEELTQAREIIRSVKITPSEELPQPEILKIVGFINEKIDAQTSEPVIEALPVRRFRAGLWARAAAVVLLASALTFLGYYYQSGGQVADQPVSGLQIVSRPGLVRLPDGTSVTLRAGSTIKYPGRFDGGKRTVFLEGEAYFEVVKKPSSPFVVMSDKMVVRVLGTSFFVRAYRHDKRFSVTVTTGKVAVLSENDISRKEVILTPNQEALVYRNKPGVTMQELPQPSVLSHEGGRNRFNFVEAPFSEVIASLSKAYEVPVEYDEQALSHCPLTASLGDLPFYEKLELICKAVEATFETHDGKIVITGKGCKPH